MRQCQTQSGYSWTIKNSGSLVDKQDYNIVDFHYGFKNLEYLQKTLKNDIK